MKSKIWFNVDRVTKIELKYEMVNDREFYPKKERGRFKFLWLIPLWKKEDLPDRWSTEEDGYYETDEYIKKCNYYRIQELPKKLFHKPWVRVHLGYKDEVFTYFDSDKDAEEFVDLIVSQSEKPFEIIKIKS